MSMRTAIDLKCKDCIFDPKAGLGTWRQQTEACTLKSCSLWPYRPKSASKSTATTGQQPEALRKYQEKRLALKQRQNAGETE